MIFLFCQTLSSQLEIAATKSPKVAIWIGNLFILLALWQKSYKKVNEVLILF